MQSLLTLLGSCCCVGRKQSLLLREKCFEKVPEVDGKIKCLLSEFKSPGRLDSAQSCSNDSIWWLA